MIGIAACDRSISAVYFLHLRDDPDLERYQSGIRRADGSARPAYAAVRTAAARAKRGCAGKQVSWRHATRVVGGRAQFGLGARVASRLRTSWGFNVTAAEEVSYVAAIFPATASKRVRSLASAASAGRGDDDGRTRPRRLEPTPALHVALSASRAATSTRCGCARA